MNYRYGEIPNQQFVDYKKRLHSLVHWLLVYADENNPILNTYFDKVQYKLNGLNSLLNYPIQILEMLNLVESAKIEYLKENYNHELYRKTVLDMHELIDKIPEDI